MRRFFLITLVSMMLTALLTIPLRNAQAAGSVTGADMIALMNSWRSGYWSNSLIEIQALDSCAQATAEEMSRIGARDHLANLGYPAASTRCTSHGFSGRVTENWAYGSNMDINTLASYWSDYSHMLPATDQQYCYIGVGISNDGYYILMAGSGSDGTCSADYVGSSGTAADMTAPTQDTSNYIPPVITSTPDYDGNIYHVVQNGQTLYTIAVYYGVGFETIKELNKLASNDIFVGDKLLISKKPTPTITLTRTPTVMIPTRTPTVTAIPTTPRPTRTITPTPDPKSLPIKVDRPTLGFGLLVISAAGFFVVLSFLFVKPLFKKKQDKV